MEYLSQFAIVHLVLHVLCICVAYWALNALRLDQLFKKGYALQVQVCMIFFAILLGTAVSNFLVDLLQYSTQLKYILQ
ncbi:putative integral membrane protein (TIGR02327 family) [Staphylococcus auricularis]|uniref:DUF1146 domain-containing protein n=1 Tax=Staphylococcus auricularis TaxID=29379 RepID=A0AAP8PQI3_9STAP|nr:DUF1146 family protein [Staphylococcus auricularis]MBM0869015.1 DUF1146 domain-containing protein [Staphylococcus auricularis]MCG7341858.1 DUF1146 family protein [Staphylococcus auricularis]MDC6328064.1 DUF1146 family protein [Staphylococcus auricularis]MDN4534194.1 DUF1146 family protein [Staphylococcus auricularis]PNZ69195.1 DUF1146 domain-containing protein [Staphylococcus auricularis]